MGSFFVRLIPWAMTGISSFIAGLSVNKTRTDPQNPVHDLYAFVRVAFMVLSVVGAISVYVQFKKRRF